MKHLSRGISMEMYLQKDTFVGRRWLFDDLNADLLHSSTHGRGILLFAEMGYGKTSIASQCICANQSSVGYQIRKHVVAYHVCRYDVYLTKTADTFIKRMSRMIASHVPEFLSQISTDSSCVELYDKQTCNTDPFGCMDQCVIHPLNKMNVSNRTLIVVIDALDECDNTIYKRENAYNDNVIYQLLKYRLQSIPTFLQFLVTSRHVAKFNDLEHYVKPYFLSSNDVLNKQDVNDFLHKMHENSTNMAFYNADSVSNFLHASKLNSSLVVSSTESIDLFYERQFERLFFDDFLIVKHVLELVCASFKHLTKVQLRHILSRWIAVDKRELNEIFVKLEHILSIIEGRVYISHNSMRVWLLERETPFQIDISSGHKGLATYLLDEISTDASSVDMVDLAIHVSFNHNNGQLSRSFTSLNSASRNISLFFPLHELLERVDIPQALELLVGVYPDINQLDNSGKSPLFVAAAFGRTQSFKLLLSKGANVNGRVQLYSNVINLSNAAKISFRDKHWGYTVLDIASQNGHYDIVETVLNDSHFNFTFSRKVGLNALAVHLACKSGHVGIVRLLVAHVGMLDFLCMYYAAEHGNTELIQYLLNENILDTCRPCNKNFDWLPANTSRLQGRNVRTGKQFGPDVYVLYDDWNRISCESVLHVAVRMNHIEVIKLLLSQKQTALHCYDRGGRTPLIAAIQSDHHEITQLLLKEGSSLNSTMRCKAMPQLTDTDQLNTQEMLALQLLQCQPGHSLLHVAAQLDRTWVFERFYSLNFTQEWDITDRDGCTPVHIAACHGSLNILKYASKSAAINKTCVNGSTVLDSAAICLSTEAVHFLIQNITLVEPYEAILQTVNAELSGDTAFNDTTVSNASMRIFRTLLKHGGNVHHVDQYNRNVLHYAVANGHFGIVHMILTRFPAASREMLQHRDLEGLTPVMLSMEKLSVKYKFKFSPRCLALTKFSMYELDVMQVLTSSELAMLRSLEFIHRNKLLEPKLIRHIHITAVEKQRFEFVSLYNRLLVKNKFALGDNEEMIDAMVNTSLANHMLFDFLLARLQFCKSVSCLLSLRADARENTDILAKMIFRPRLIGYKNTDIDYFTDFVFNFTFVIPFRDDPDLLSDATDSRGYNVYDRAVQVNNHVLLQQFHKIGVKSKLDKIKLLNQALTFDSSTYEASLISMDEHILSFEMVKRETRYSRLLREDQNISSKKDQLYRLIQDFGDRVGGMPYRSNNDTDKTIVFLLDKFKTTIPKLFLCCRKCYKFSFVHTIAMYGLIESTKYIRNTWGITFVECSNGDDITPLYLSKVFGRGHVEHYLEKECGLQLTLPKPKAELTLLYKVWSRFRLNRSKNEPVNCLLDFRWTISMNVRSNQKSLRCFKHIAKTLGNHKQLAWRITVFKLYMRHLSLSTYFKHVYTMFVLWIRSSPSRNYIPIASHSLTTEQTCRNIFFNLKKLLRIRLNIPESKCYPKTCLSEILRYLHEMHDPRPKDCLELLEDLEYSGLRPSKVHNVFYRQLVNDVFRELLDIFSKNYVINTFLTDRATQTLSTAFNNPSWLWNQHIFKYMNIIEHMDVYKDLYMWGEGRVDAFINLTAGIIRINELLTWTENARLIKSDNVNKGKRDSQSRKSHP